MSEKNWNFALPEDGEVFKAMNDVLYTYLYSISKHNPKKSYGGYKENYNYIYLDKGPNGEKKYSPKETYEKLKISRPTYYRRFNKLIELGLIEKGEYKGRKVLYIPFIESKKILDVRTCKFLTEYCENGGTFVPDDIIKVLCLLKIFLYSDDKTFTIRKLKANLGYSLENNQKDGYIFKLLDILRGLDLIEYEGYIKKEGDVERLILTILKVDDRYNSRLEWHEIKEETHDFEEQKYPIK